jgi:hypothetical protein
MVKLITLVDAQSGVPHGLLMVDNDFLPTIRTIVSHPASHASDEETRDKDLFACRTRHAREEAKAVCQSGEPPEAPLSKAHLKIGRFRSSRNTFPEIHTIPMAVRSETDIVSSHLLTHGARSPFDASFLTCFGLLPQRFCKASCQDL